LAAAKVLDNWALLCYLEQKPGYEKITDLLEKAVESSKPLLMCIVNWGEVYHQVVVRFGDQKAQEIEQLVQTLPITLIEETRSSPVRRRVSRLKNRWPTQILLLSPSPRFRKAELYTGAPGFKVVEKEVKIFWP
jgi:hypothetical protein